MSVSPDGLRQDLSTCSSPGTLSGSPLHTLSWPISLSLYFTKIPKSKEPNLIPAAGPFSPSHSKVPGFSENMLAIYPFHTSSHIIKKNGIKESCIPSVCSCCLSPYFLLGRMLNVGDLQSQRLSPREVRRCSQSSFSFFLTCNLHNFPDKPEKIVIFKRL